MKNLLAVSVLLLGSIIVSTPVFGETIKVIKNVEQPYYNNYNYESMYSADLNNVERYLFRRVYSNENINSRLARIERYLFNKTYPSMNTTNRMNNIMANYQDDATYTRNYLSNYYDDSTPIARIRNRLIGQPTGFTPQISPFGSMFSPTFSSSNISNRGYNYNNGIPMGTGAGIHILP